MPFSEFELQHLQSKLSNKKVCVELLDKAIGQAMNNPLLLSKAKEGVGFDLIGYMDALLFLSEILDEEHFFNEPFNKDHLDGSCVFQWHIKDTPTNAEIEPDMLLAEHFGIVMNLSLNGEDFAHIKRLMGFHNLSSNQLLFKDKKLNILVPFELVILLDKKTLPHPDVPANLMFNMEPLNPVFKTILTPAPVSAIVVDGDMSGLQGYVVHPNILFDALKQNEEWRDERFDNASDAEIRQALQWDTQLSLKLLKNRYLVDVGDDYISRIGQLDEKIYQTHRQYGAAVLEL